MTGQNDKWRGRVTMPLEERQKRYKDMKAAKEAGKSYAAIGREFDVSPQRAAEIINGPEPFGPPGQNTNAKSLRGEADAGREPTDD